VSISYWRKAVVVCMIRDPQVAEELNVKGVTAVVGDAFDIKDGEISWTVYDAAITTLGGEQIADVLKVDYGSNGNVIECRDFRLST
jgi:hypothetical protein